MTEYEYRRAVFYALNPGDEFPDNHKNFDITLHPETVVDDAVAYLTEGTRHTRFPGAARAVAIATAQVLSREFGIDFHTALQDPNLMNGNDPYYKTYFEDKVTYDLILQRVNRDELNWQTPRMQITYNLLLQEYMLDDEGVKLLPRSIWK